jgi:hypothetical protein
VAAFLLPFVTIRLVAGDRQSGAAKLEEQQPLSSVPRMAIKAAVLFGGSEPVLQPPVKGRVGLWSKTDSTSEFKDYVVTTRPE